MAEVASTVSTAAFSSVCSESMIARYRTTRSPTRDRSESSSARAALLHAPRSPGPASAASAPRSPAPRGASRGAPPRERRGYHDERDERRRGDAERDRRLAVCDAEHHRQREAHARERLHQHQTAEQREVLVPGQPAAREVAGGVGERADDEHVSRARCSGRRRGRSALLCSASATTRKASAKPAWIAIGTRSGVLGVPACAALGDRAREQLFDRPVDHRDDHEHHRPQHVDALGRFCARARGSRSRSTRTSAGPSQAIPIDRMRAPLP